MDGLLGLIKKLKTHRAPRLMTHGPRAVETLTQGGERSPGSGGKRAWLGGRERDNAWNPRSQTPSGRQEESASCNKVWNCWWQQMELLDHVEQRSIVVGPCGGRLWQSRLRNSRNGTWRWVAEQRLGTGTTQTEAAFPASHGDLTPTPQHQIPPVMLIMIADNGEILLFSCPTCSTVT